MNLGQRITHALRDRRQPQVRGESRRATGAGAAQLVLHDVVHAPHLLHDAGAQLRLGFVGRIAQHRQRGLQAVGQVAQGLLEAGLAHPFLADQGVEVVGECRDLARVPLLHLGLFTAFDAPDLACDAAQRRQSPLQQRGLRQQQQQAGAAEPGPQGAGKGGHLALECGGVLEHRDLQHRGLRTDDPAHAVGHGQVVPPVGRGRCEPPLTDRCILQERGVDADRRGRAPGGVTRQVAYAGIQARTGQRQARLGKRGGHHQRAVGIDLRAGQQQVDRALQLGVMRRAHAVGVGALHGPSGGGHEGQQHQRRAQDQAGTDRAARQVLQQRPRHARPVRRARSKGAGPRRFIAA